jgi:uncharacterized protein YjhX (UPF0386 family)
MKAFFIDYVLSVDAFAIYVQVDLARDAPGGLAHVLFFTRAGIFLHECTIPTLMRP